MKRPKVYLGDSVYGESDGFRIVLTTENGNGPTNTIVLEPEVFNAAMKLYADAYEAAQALS